MLFEETDCDFRDERPSITQGKAEMPEARRTLLPAQEWRLAANACCASRMTEVKTGEVATVPVYEHSGYLYAVFGVLYGGHTGVFQAEGWQLLPRRLFTGNTTAYIEWLHVDESERVRGDYTGMLVKVRGAEMVCTKPVHFLRSLPTVTPLSMAAAATFDASARCSGWRARKHQDTKATWAKLAGHPVVIYDNGDPHERLAMLLWKSEEGIEEYILPKSHDFASLEPCETTTHHELVVEVPPERPLTQAALF